MPEKPLIDYDAYRDHIGTVDDTGKRRWVYPKKPSGRFHNKRVWVSMAFLTALFVGPFLKYDDLPLFLFNILERKFIIFGVTFWPQDFHLFALAMVTFMVFIVLFTVVFGRVFCGWVCPQTVFMEMVFRKIEYLIEGDANKQRKLAKAPWDVDKTLKRILKYSIFAAIAFLIGNLVMAYMIGIDELQKIVTEGPGENMGKFTFVLLFSGIFFFVFSYLREQACIAICPYGRLQGVLLDKDSIVVAYDNVRGEPRAHLRKKETREAGDCVDCKLCVQVCPTGIDIRDGTQLECVNCTACIDACDNIMDKVGFDRGLIRYASRNNIDKGLKFRFTPRIIAYSVVLLGLISILGFSLSTRSDVEMTLLRTKGVPYQEVDDGYIANLFNLQIVNKTRNGYDLSFKVLSPEGGRTRIVGNKLSMQSQGITKGAIFIEFDKKTLEETKIPIVLGVFAGDTLLDKVETTFRGPLKIKYD